MLVFFLVAEQCFAAQAASEDETFGMHADESIVVAAQAQKVSSNPIPATPYPGSGSRHSPCGVFRSNTGRSSRCGSLSFSPGVCRAVHPPLKEGREALPVPVEGTLTICGVCVPCRRESTASSNIFLLYNRTDPVTRSEKTLIWKVCGCETCLHHTANTALHRMAWPAASLALTY